MCQIEYAPYGLVVRSMSRQSARLDWLAMKNPARFEVQVRMAASM